MAILSRFALICWLSAALASPVASGADLAVGDYHACTLVAGKGVHCWGDNTYGELGDGTRMERDVAVAVAGLPTGITSLAAGGAHTCALEQSGEVYCWGWNAFGQLGDGGAAAGEVPRRVPGIASAVSISAGDLHACALLADGRISCWGSAYGFVLGSASDGSIPADVDGFNAQHRAVALTSGSYHNCALDEAGAAWCWGSNGSGELGTNAGAGGLVPVQVGVGALVAISAGGRHTCGRDNVGALSCWGANDLGQQGRTPSATLLPMTVPGWEEDASLVGSGWLHTCAARENGRVLCWGDNREGQLGDGSLDNSSTGREVGGLPASVTELALGAYFSCARIADGQVYCWGSDFYGQLGADIDDGTALPPAEVDPGALFTDVSAGRFHTCAVRVDGVGLCWGMDRNGQLGTQEEGEQSLPTAVAMTGVNGEIVASGGSHSCLADSAGSAHCWGFGAVGSLGLGGSSDHSLPQTLPAPTDVVELSAGEYHTCARSSDGALRCWGRNDEGELGLGDTATRWSPTVLPGFAVEQVDAGDFHTCMVSSATVFCFGGNFGGQLGDGTTQDGYVPTPVLVSAVAKVASGANHTCALHTNGKVSCWGYNGEGQLGRNDVGVEVALPAMINSLQDAYTIGVGAHHSCAADSDGLKCWGYNLYGQIGTGARLPERIPGPVSVQGLPPGPVIDVDGGAYHTCAIVQPGRLFCWGNNHYGQLGVDRVGYRTQPQRVLGIEVEPDIFSDGFEAPTAATLLGSALPASMAMDGGVLRTP